MRRRREPHLELAYLPLLLAPLSVLLEQVPELPPLLGAVKGADHRGSEVGYGRRHDGDGKTDERDAGDTAGPAVFSSHGSTPDPKRLTVHGGGERSVVPSEGDSDLYVGRVRPRSADELDREAAGGV